MTLCLLAFGLQAQYGDTFLGELPCKVDALKKSEGKRIVVIGGSGVAFGQRSDLLEAELDGYTVVNFGMYAGLGSTVMLDLAESFIREGDIVIFSPEQSEQTLSMYFSPESMWQAADGRFELHYYGREQQVALNLKAYASELNVENVFFHGEYTPEQRYEFVRQTDVIHNVYYDDNTMLAMGNKYYDGVIFRIPQICMMGSFMGECVENAGVGLTCDPYDNDFTDIMYEYYRGLDKNEFDRKCDVELERIMGEYNYANEILYQLQ